ncbi:hypothetical protein [Halanaerobium sp.]|uniref:hypothetical protein n=1 Tax=Halanaerobium sp. TaxID=1895664 RepID=UPI000DE71BAC|nr:hypothetical protein [Halanaerobium sp.]PUU93674.1 MAG: hypothetical protein CI949_1277 [Halanaerobium sp.]
MLKLKNKSFKIITENLKEKARPIDRERFNFHFNNAGPEKLLAEIKKYQNEDGGFGQALEPDFRLPLSTPMATSIALRYLKNLDNTKPAQALIKRAISYLEKSFNQSRKGWYAVNKEVNNYPHTPWWHYDEEAKMTVIDKNWGNPSAELLAYLYRYKDYNKSIDLNPLIDYAVEQINEKDKYESENEIYCYLKLYEEVDSKTKPLLKGNIAEGIKQLIVYDQNKWQEYVPLPLDFVPAPEKESFGVSESKIEANLDFYVELIEKSRDTLVKPPWGESFYQTDLKETYQEWQGNWTLKILITLNNYGRIEK